MIVRLRCSARGGWSPRRSRSAASRSGSPARGAFFQRPEVRDAIAWLRVLADPNDAAAASGALTRPPVELRSVDLARCTTIARRRKLDMVSALEAALESPQLRPRPATGSRPSCGSTGRRRALEEMRADVFVRRLIERIGLRRHQLFAASPETAERLVSLSRLGELAAAWTRREPRGSTRDFVRYVTAVADAGELGDDPLAGPPPGAVLLAEPEQVKGLEFDHVYLLGLHAARSPGRPERARVDPDELLAEGPSARPTTRAAAPARLAYVAMTRARAAPVVLAWPEETTGRPAGPVAALRGRARRSTATRRSTRRSCSAPPRGCTPPTGCSATRCSRASWRAGAALGEMRLDTAEDVNRAVARFLELVKLAALIQRPGAEPAADAIEALNQLLAQAATPEQRGALEASALDEYLIEEERERARRRELIAARREPSLEAFIPRRGGGLALSASDIDLYRTCPLKYKFARVFAIPQEPTINQRFGILIHQVLERFHADELRGDDRAGETGAARGPRPAAGPVRGRLAAHRVRLHDDELQYRDRAVAALARYWERHVHAPTGRSGSSAASRSRSARTSCAGASTASTAFPTAATS